MKNKLRKAYSALCLAEGIIEDIYGEVEELCLKDKETSVLDEHKYFLQDLLDLVQTLTNKPEFDQYK
tara:strand:- start:618 stop:818 length:201 start_codon:yes stop_codon:yes gene_type:complete